MGVALTSDRVPPGSERLSNFVYGSGVNSTKRLASDTMELLLGFGLSTEV